MRPQDPGLHLWLVALAGASPAPKELGCLSPNERERAHRFRVESARQAYLASHVALRGTLSALTGMPAAELAFCRELGGKPVLTGSGAAVQFSLSHTERWAVIGACRASSVGVDVERINPRVNVGELLARLSPELAVGLPRPSDASHQQACFRAWTRYEACVKAQGGGLTARPRLLYLPPPVQPLREWHEVRIGDWTGWLRDMDVDETHTAAVAVQVRPDQVTLYRWPLARPA